MHGLFTCPTCDGKDPFEFLHNAPSYGIPNGMVVRPLCRLNGITSELPDGAYIAWDSVCPMPITYVDGILSLGYSQFNLQAVVKETATQQSQLVIANQLVKYDPDNDLVSPPSPISSIFKVTANDKVYIWGEPIIGLDSVKLTLERR